MYVLSIARTFCKQSYGLLKTTDEVAQTLVLKGFPYQWELLFWIGLS